MRVLTTVRFLVVQFNAVQQPVMAYSAAQSGSWAVTESRLLRRPWPRRLHREPEPIS